MTAKTKRIKTCVVKRRDDLDGDPPYCEALDGSEFLIIEAKDKYKRWKRRICVCDDRKIAEQISNAFNRGILLDVEYSL